MLNDSIRTLRKQNKLTQAGLAAMLNVTQQSVAKWEKAIAEPDIDNILRLADLFSVSTDYLLGRSPVGADDSVRPPFPVLDGGPGAPLVSPADRALLAAYHAAPAPIRDAVDGLLAPYQKENPAGISGEAM